MASLIRDPAGRERLGLAGEARVRSLFSMGSGIDMLAKRFGVQTAAKEGMEPDREHLVVAVAEGG
jgi:hypothetical protein